MGYVSNALGMGVKFSYTDMKGFKVSDARMEFGDGGWPGDTTAG